MRGLLQSALQADVMFCVFRRVLVVTKRAYYIRHVHPSVGLAVRPNFFLYQRGYHWTNFHVISYHMTSHLHQTSFDLPNIWRAVQSCSSSICNLLHSLFTLYFSDPYVSLITCSRTARSVTFLSCELICSRCNFTFERVEFIPKWNRRYSAA